MHLHDNRVIFPIFNRMDLLEQLIIECSDKSVVIRAIEIVEQYSESSFLLGEAFSVRLLSLVKQIRHDHEVLWKVVLAEISKLMGTVTCVFFRA